MRYYAFLVLTLLLAACQPKQSNGSSEVIVKEVPAPKTRNIVEVEQRDTTSVDFKTHQELLHIITLLPDSAMVNWDWSKQDRTAFYKTVETNGYVIDTSSIFFGYERITPTRMVLQIVDGSWAVYLYQAADRSKLVITDAIATGGHSLRFFHFVSNHLTSLPEDSVFVEPLSRLRLKKGVCREPYVDELKMGLWDYKFDMSSLVLSTWMLKQTEDSSCVSGNTLTYAFNPIKRKFALKNVDWSRN